MLTQKQYQLLLFINKTLKETGCCPSFDEMRQAVGLKSKSGIHALITALEDRGFLRKLPHKARALEVVKLPKIKPVSEKKEVVAQETNGAQIPLYGKVAAGLPIEAIVDETQTVSVPFEMVAKGSYYALTIEGDSMVDLGILDGDTIIVRKTEVANNGDVVVALVNNQDATLKKFYKEKDNVKLIPFNSAHSTQTYHASQVKIQGILSGLLRSYH